MAYQAEIFQEYTFGLVDYKYLINWNLKNTRLCWVFADLVTNRNAFLKEFQMLFIPQQDEILEVC